MAVQKFVSWNVNGVRAIAGKGFSDIFAAFDADIFCLQETKVQAGQFEIELPGYRQYWHYAQRKGYSGTAVFAREAPLNVRYDIGIPGFDDEGRTVTLEYENFFFITVYTPNAKDGLVRIDYRMQWEDAFRAYLKTLDAQKPVIFCGDLNVAHNEIDLKNPKTNRGNPGFSDEERGKFRELLAAGFTDTFRHFYPDLKDAYTWWSYRFNARANNAGWRIDYFMVSERLKDNLKDASIHADVFGSDHCPVALIIDL